MKTLIVLCAALCMAACSSLPPEPHGQAFPINGNHTAEAGK